MEPYANDGLPGLDNLIRALDGLPWIHRGVQHPEEGAQAFAPWILGHEDLSSVQRAVVPGGQVVHSCSIPGNSCVALSIRVQQKLRNAAFLRCGLRTAAPSASPRLQA